MGVEDVGPIFYPWYFDFEDGVIKKDCVYDDQPYNKGVSTADKIWHYDESRTERVYANVPMNITKIEGWEQALDWWKNLDWKNINPYDPRYLIALQYAFLERFGKGVISSLNVLSKGKIIESFRQIMQRFYTFNSGRYNVFLFKKGDLLNDAIYYPERALYYSAGQTFQYNIPNVRNFEQYKFCLKNLRDWFKQGTFVKIDMPDPTSPIILDLETYYKEARFTLAQLEYPPIEDVTVVEKLTLPFKVRVLCDKKFYDKWEDVEQVDYDFSFQRIVDTLLETEETNLLSMCVQPMWSFMIFADIGVNIYGFARNRIRSSGIKYKDREEDEFLKIGADYFVDKSYVFKANVNINMIPQDYYQYQNEGDMGDSYKKGYYLDIDASYSVTYMTDIWYMTQIFGSLRFVVRDNEGHYFYLHTDEEGERGHTRIYLGLMHNKNTEYVDDFKNYFIDNDFMYFNSKKFIEDVITKHGGNLEEKFFEREDKQNFFTIDYEYTLSIVSVFIDYTKGGIPLKFI